jgi:hypothetical protein
MRHLILRAPRGKGKLESRIDFLRTTISAAAVRQLHSIAVRHISGTVVNLQGKEVFRAADPDLYLVPLVISVDMCRSISQDVLIAELEAGSRGGVRNAGRIIERDGAAAGGLCNFGEPLPPKTLLQLFSE